jgi:hypothetical protein
VTDAAPAIDFTQGSIDSLLPKPPRDLTERMGALYEHKIETDDAISAATERRAEYDRQQMQRAFEQTGFEAATALKPWDAKEEARKTAYDPIEAFGSIGSVFGILASAFTHAPMANALNASAAAMEAVRAGKEDEFQKNFQAWKANNDLAVKRFEMERQHFTDAATLMDRDLAAGTRLASLNALRFGDQKAKLLLDMGMVKEWYELQESRAKLGEENIRLNGEITQDSLRRKVLETDPGWNVGKEQDPSKPPVDPRLVAVRRLEAFNRAYGVKETPQQELMGRWFFEHPEGTAEEAADYYKDTFVRQPQTLSAQQFQAVDDLVEQGVPREEAIRRVTQASAKPASGGQPGMGKEEALAVEELLRANPGMSRTEAIAQVKRSAATITGNKADDIRSRIDLFDNSTTKIDAALETLNKHVLSAGLAGRVTRMGERVGNIFGSSDTDREQFMRDIKYLQTLAPQLLTDRHGRPLSSEAGSISDIIGGLSLGDTTANTIRSLEEVKRLYAKMREDNTKRLGGTWTPGPEHPTATPPPPASGGWRSAPLVQ